MDSSFGNFNIVLRQKRRQARTLPFFAPRAPFFDAKLQKGDELYKEFMIPLLPILQMNALQ
jgi:hypothetical protein